MKKSLIFIGFLTLMCICLTGCKTYVPVPAYTPCCQNPFHDHYKAPPMMLWTEKITTDTHRVEERFWQPTF